MARARSRAALLARGLWGVCALSVVHAHVGHFALCKGPSMLPTLHRFGDIVVVDRASLHFTPVSRSEIVVCASPYDPKKTVIKRVRGLEGDTIHVRSITGEEPEHEITIPKGHIWIEGDNPHQSTDSRHYGPLPLAMVKGRVRFRLWPLPSAGRLR